MVKYLDIFKDNDTPDLKTRFTIFKKINPKGGKTGKRNLKWIGNFYVESIQTSYKK